LFLGYILRDEHPFCIKCYEETFANVCDECGKAIGIDSKDLSYKDKHWHEECEFFAGQAPTEKLLTFLAAFLVKPELHQLNI
jgi:hypothetical protein